MKMRFGSLFQIIILHGIAEEACKEQEVLRSIKSALIQIASVLRCADLIGKEIFEIKLLRKQSNLQKS